MGVGVWFVLSKTCEHESHGMSGRHQHRPQQDRHVIAIAGAQLEHSAGRMQKLNPENVSRVPDVPLDEIKERTNFTQPVLGLDSISPKNFYGLLPDVEVFRSILYQPGNNSGGGKCSLRAFGHTEDSNPGDNMTTG